MLKSGEISNLDSYIFDADTKIAPTSTEVEMLISANVLLYPVAA